MQHSNSDGLQNANCAEVWWCCSINIAWDLSLGQSDQCGNLKAIRGDPAGVARVCVCVYACALAVIQRRHHGRDGGLCQGSRRADGRIGGAWRGSADSVGKHQRRQSIAKYHSDEKKIRIKVPVCNISLARVFK